MKIAIVDDRADERTRLRNRLETALNRRSVHADYFEYENGERFLADAKRDRFSVVFLDIYMPGTNGVDTAKELRSFDADCPLIFITTSTDHALQGFQVRAMHYLVKPFSDDEIDRLTDELLSRTPQVDKYVEIKMDGSKIRVPYQNIIYAEHFAHSIHIHTTVQKTLTTRMSFRDFITPFKDDSRFFICSRGVMINLEHAADFDESAFLTDDGNRIFVNRELTRTARQAFMEFLLQRGR